MTSVAAILNSSGSAVSGAFAGGTVTLNSDGTATGTSYSGNANWYQPTTTGVGSRFWARTTRTSGQSGVVFSPASGTWWSLSSGRTWSATGGSGGCTGTIELATDSGGANIVATGTISVSNAL
jgi:hypothetical protein